MSVALAPPAGVADRRPTGGAVVEWQIDDGSHGRLSLRVFPPIEDGRTAFVEIRTGPAGFGPDITDPAALRRAGWAFLSACQALADALEEPAPVDGPPTLFDEIPT